MSGRCVVCNDELPEHRKLTCSRECWVMFQIDWERGKHKGKNVHSPNAYKLPARIKRLQAQTQGKTKHNCDQCGIEFKASHSRQRYCSTICKAIHTKVDSNEDTWTRREPSMPKMPWDKPNE